MPFCKTYSLQIGESPRVEILSRALKPGDEVVLSSNSVSPDMRLVEMTVFAVLPNGSGELQVLERELVPGNGVRTRILEAYSVGSDYFRKLPSGCLLVGVQSAIEWKDDSHE